MVCFIYWWLYSSNLNFLGDGQIRSTAPIYYGTNNLAKALKEFILTLAKNMLIIAFQTLPIYHVEKDFLMILKWYFEYKLQNIEIDLF